MRSLLATLALSGVLVACDTTTDSPVDTPDDDEPAVEDTRPTVTSSDDLAGLTGRTFSAALLPDLSVSTGYGSSAGYGAPEFSAPGSVLYGSGLWLSGRQDGAARVAIERYGTSSFGPCDDTPNVVYSVDADTTYSPDGWPVEAGAPTDEEGQPRAYGDQMAWVPTCTRDSGEITGHTLAGVRVNAALFGYEDTGDVIYVRYEIRNERGGPISDAYAGFWADADLTSGDFGPRANLIGFDREAGIGYVYMAELDGTREIPASSRGAVAGVTVLQSPGAAPVAAYRIMDNHGDAYGEGLAETPDGAAYALRGLSNLGDPMIDPTTGEASRFAYTGDPAAGTGWLDGFDGCGNSCVEGQQMGEDVRQLTSVGPFSLGAGESTVFTIAYVYQARADLEAGLTGLRRSIQEIRDAPSRWRFPTAE